MSLRARGIEALAGTVLGVGAGAAAGRVGYRPDFPLEWSDDQGVIRARKLDPEERAARRSLMANAALVGAGVGMAAALGGSIFRRSVLSKAERRAAKDLSDSYLVDLQEILDKDRAKYHALAQTPGKTDTQTAKQMRKRIDVAQGILRKEEDHVNDLLNTASEMRAQKPFGGRNWSKRRGERVPFHEASHSELVKKHFNQLAKSVGLPAFSPRKGPEMFEALIQQGTTKTAEAYRREVLMILGAA